MAAFLKKPALSGRTGMRFSGIRTVVCAGSFYLFMTAGQVLAC